MIPTCMYSQEFRGFELLRRGREPIILCVCVRALARSHNCFWSGGDRTNYLLVKEAKIIAMTCTHAALKRKDMVELNFQVG